MLEARVAMQKEAPTQGVRMVTVGNGTGKPSLAGPPRGHCFPPDVRVGEPGVPILTPTV